MIREINDQLFSEEVLNSKPPVIVAFWAGWCAPCRMLWPVLEELDQAYKDKIKIVKLDIEENALTVERFAIHSIPSLLIFKNSRIVEQVIGNYTKAELSGLADRIFNEE
jgi:thioredoxin 1